MPDQPAPQAPEGPADARGLSARVASGDELAFTLLYHRWHAHVRRTVRTSLGDDPSVDDTTQEVFMKVIRKMPVLDTDAAIGAWLTTTARRCAVDTLRARKRHRRDREHEGLGETSEHPAPTEFDHALRLLEESEDELRGLIESRVRFGWTLERIGRAFGLTPSAVDGRLKRSFRKMRESMNEGERA